MEAILETYNTLHAEQKKKIKKQEKEQSQKL